MEEFIEEFNRRAQLFENLDQLIVEAYLQKELMISIVMKDDMIAYRMSPECDQTVLKFLEILEMDDVEGVEQNDQTRSPLRYYSVF